MVASPSTSDVRARVPVVSHTLTAGPLTMLFEDGRLHYVRFGEREVLRRVYVAVRDSTWATVPTVISDVVLKQGADAFTLDFDAVCQIANPKGDIDFRWHGSVVGQADGRVVYRLEGESFSDFQSNRVGICVCHPIHEYLGQPCQIENMDGEQIEAAFPETIDPHLPFSNIRVMTHQVEPGVQATLRFEGDTFETEDQRQWGDASLKTYSRPHTLPRPYEVAQGSWVVQSVTLDVRADKPPARHHEDRVDVAIDVDPAVVFALPQIGVALPPGVPPHSADQRALLALLGLHHLRLDLVTARSGSAEELERAVAECRALKVPLELVVYLSRSAAPELGRLAQILEQLNPPLSGITLASMVDPVPSVDLRRVARKNLSHVVPDVAVGVGSYPHFTELNRNRDAAQGAAFLAAPFWPQAHTEDDRTLAENLVTPTWMVETAESFAANVPVHLGPIALRKQPRAGATDQILVGDGSLPPYVDARQPTVFAAGWTALHIAELARAGVARAGYFQTSGWLGIMPGDTALPDGFAPSGAQVYPVFHVLADVGEWRGDRKSGLGKVLSVRSSDPLEVGALALCRGQDVRILVFNLGTRRRLVTLKGGPESGVLRRLDAANATAAMADPTAFRAEAPAPWDGAPLELLPGQIVRVDGTV